MLKTLLNRSLTIAELQEHRTDYATSLAYSLKKMDAWFLWANQHIGIYGNVYAIGTDCDQGFYVQTSPGVVIAASREDFSVVRHL